MPIKIAVTNRKGGCGKSTISISLAQLISRQGYKVALIDLDTQSNPAVMLGAAPSLDNVTNWLEGLSPAFTTIQIDKDPAFQILDGLNRIPDIRDNSLDLLTNELPHDIVIFDCGPGEGILSIASAVISDFVVIPMLSDAFSGSGASAVRMLLRSEQEKVFVFNMFQEQKYQDRFLFTRFRMENPGEPVFVIRAEELLRNNCTTGMGLPKKGKASQDLWKIAEHIMNKLQVFA